MSRRTATAALGVAAATLVVILSIPRPSAAAAPPATAPGPPALVILADTGQTRDGLPVLTRHPDSSAARAVLTHGFSGRLLHLFALEQAFLRRTTGRRPEPAYLLLSTNQGGFPRFGFYLDGEKKADVGWVDLHRNSNLVGRFGAMDQIFPHELLHVIVRQLAGEPRESGSNQIHAVGVRTDTVNAFSEGFAEHVQILAVDDPDAAPSTRALRTDAELLERATRAATAYQRDLASGWLPVRPAQMRFLFWFSSSEQAWRYHAVKANAFARVPTLPPSVESRADKYDAYLLRSVLPGDPNGDAKPAAAMLSTEGVVAHLFWRFVTDDALQHRYAPESLYARFGTSLADVTPMDNVYLKLFAALAEGRPSTSADLLRAYITLFPDDAADAARVVRAALLDQELPPAAPELWLANDSLMTGTSLFDQYRGLPRAHTFDVNAATTFDWLAVPGVTRDLAGTLVTSAPYASLDEIRAKVTPEVATRVSSMATAMKALAAHAADEEDTLGLWAIARPYLVRLAGVLAVSAALGGWLARRAGARRWWTASFVGAAAALLTIGLAWFVIAPPWYPVLAPAVLGGLPWALWRLVRHRSPSTALRAFGVWAAASLPAILVSGAWAGF